MKKIFAILIIFFICAIGKAATDSNNTIVPDSNITAVPDTNTTADSQEKIKQLERIIESLQKRLDKIITANNDLKKQLDEQIKENERLKNLSSQAGSDTSSLKEIKPLKVESPNLSDISLGQLYQFCEKPITDLQREEQYKNNYKWKWVQWTGTVEAVSLLRREKGVAEYYLVTFIHIHPDKNLAQSKFIVKVIVQFDKMLKQRLLSLKKGAIVTYQGKLPNSYKDLGTICGFPESSKGGMLIVGHLNLTDGNIVSP